MHAMSASSRTSAKGLQKRKFTTPSGENGKTGRMTTGGGVIDLTSDAHLKTEESDVIVITDDEDDEQKSRPGGVTPGDIVCPVCMDGYAEITYSGRLVVSTLCGHVFCSQCLRDALRHSQRCPKCRKKVTYRQYHPIYV